MTHDNEHPIDDFVRRAVGVNEEQVAAQWSASEAKQDLLQEITSMPVDTPTRTAPRTELPRRRLVPAIAMAVMLLSAVGAYAASTYLGEAIPNSPWISTEEAAERVPEFADDIPIPEGRDFTGRSQMYLELRRPGNVQVAGIPERMADDAVCMWLDEWLIAHNAGDTRRAVTALDMVEDAPDWPHWTVNNAETISAHIRGLAEAARAGDTDAVSRELGLNCASYTTSVPHPGPRTDRRLHEAVRPGAAP